MLDGTIRKKIDPILNSLAAKLIKANVTADQITVAGFLIGSLASISILNNQFAFGLALLLVSRLCDGLDGAVAKQTQSTNFGAFLDIVLDFIFYGMIPIAFAFQNPEQNALAAAVLVFSFYANGSSFLAFSIMAEKQKMKTDVRGSKSFFFTTGLTEATETIFLFALFCLLPGYFAEVAYLFSTLCFYTTIVRIWQAKQLF